MEAIVGYILNILLDKNGIVGHFLNILLDETTPIFLSDGFSVSIAADIITMLFEILLIYAIIGRFSKLRAKKDKIIERDWIVVQTRDNIIKMLLAESEILREQEYERIRRRFEFSESLLPSDSYVYIFSLIEELGNHKSENGKTTENVVLLEVFNCFVNSLELSKRDSKIHSDVFNGYLTGSFGG